MARKKLCRQSREKSQSRRLEAGGRGGWGKGTFSLPPELAFFFPLWVLNSALPPLFSYS